jgi:hypothetical protein
VGRREGIDQRTHAVAGTRVHSSQAPPGSANRMVPDEPAAGRGSREEKTSDDEEARVGLFGRRHGVTNGRFEGGPGCDPHSDGDRKSGEREQRASAEAGSHRLRAATRHVVLRWCFSGREA